MATIVPVLDHSGLGAYWRKLREHRGWSQTELVRRLRAAGLPATIKQIYGWEKALHKPEAVSKIKMDEILGGTATISDELLMYDLERAPRRADLEARLVALAQSEPADYNERLEHVRQQQVLVDKLVKLSKEAVRHGEQMAESWLSIRDLKILERAASEVPKDRLAEAQFIVMQMLLEDPDAAGKLLDQHAQRTGRGPFFSIRRSATY